MHHAVPSSWLVRWLGRALAGGLALSVAALVAPIGCSSSPSAACDSSKCAAGNECIDDGSGSGPTCHKVCTRAAECPAGWSCNLGETSQPKNWCVQGGAGKYGTSCAPGGGESSNPACDANDGFVCLGGSPTDANAFCTTLGCAKDGDCPHGWWCATVNDGPNVATATRTFGKTRAACVPRAYCAPCGSDADCDAAPDGTPLFCAGDIQGSGFCTPQCATSTDCPLDATCILQATICAPSQGGACRVDSDCPPSSQHVYQHCDGGRCTPECGGPQDCLAGQSCVTRGLCLPRAGVCKGSGGFCSPCRSDADCTGGFCLSAAPYSTEHFCSVASTVAPCASQGVDPPGCPPRKGGDNWVGSECATLPPGQPAQCVGVVTFGTSTGNPQDVLGCWTVNR